MDSWEKFNESALPLKEAFYSNLNLKDITDKDSTHAQKVWDVFEIKNIGEYHDLYKRNACKVRESEMLKVKIVK